MSKIAVDTNVLIYLHDGLNSSKKSAAESILAENPNIPAQVISEYLNTTRRLLTLSKENLLLQTSELFSNCEIIPISSSTLLKSAELIKKFQFQLFDAIIVAASLQAGCDILYSEDMHHGLLINNSLTILNPFSF
jgi:predicted nucleic acid-binding protein